LIYRFSSKFSLSVNPIRVKSSPPRTITAGEFSNSPGAATPAAKLIRDAGTETFRARLEKATKSLFQLLRPRGVTIQFV
jgi:hypothetical protein